MGLILLLEDDESLNRGISLKLRKEGYEVLSARGIKEAESFFAEYKNSIDLIISDITMPDGSGLGFCQEVRTGSNVFVLFLTALDQEVDIVNGYDIGADDYMTKPFSLMVLISKVNAFMRRVEQKEDSGVVFTSGAVTFNCKEMKVYKEEELALSKKELQLLLYFLEHPQQIMSKEQILEAVWDIDGQFVDDNTVPVTISRLKKKLSEGCSAEYIKNVRGIGYIWTTEVLKK